MHGIQRITRNLLYLLIHLLAMATDPDIKPILHDNAIIALAEDEKKRDLAFRKMKILVFADGWVVTSVSLTWEHNLFIILVFCVARFQGF